MRGGTETHFFLNILTLLLGCPLCADQFLI